MHARPILSLFLVALAPSAMFAVETPRPVAKVETLPPAPAMQTLTTAKGSKFGLFGAKPTKPAPTLFMFAQSVEYMRDRATFNEVGQRLAAHGYLYVVVDPPCHGADSKPGEPPELRGWRYRIDQGESLVEPFTQRASDVLDHLVNEGYTDVAKVAVVGTSRGGFLALHFAAADARIRAVATFSPVTDLAALSEFRGDEQHPTVQSLSTLNLADKLAGRAVWISIGNNDARVSTEAAIALSRKLVAVGVAKAPPDPKPIVPVELIVGPSSGHSAIQHAHALAAVWLLKQMQ